MADDLSEQLSLTAKLAAQVERLAAAAEKVEASYNNQIAAVEKLQNLFGQVNAGAATQSVEAFNKALRDGAKDMKDMGKVSESSLNRLGKKLTDVGKGFSGKFPKSVAVATAALSGLEQGFRNITALGKGVTGFVTSFVDGLANITASIISIPIKMFQGLFDMAVKSAGGSNELAEAIEKLRKQFGELYGPTNKAIIDTSKSLKGFADTGLSAWRVFGNLAQRLNELRELATEMGAQFNKFHQEFEDNGGALLAYQKGLGLDNEAMKAIGITAQVTGKSMSSVLKDFTKFSKSLADSDVDAKLLSRDMGKMAKDVKHFGQLGARELSEVALYARKLGVEVDKMTSTLDAFESFDTAAEHAAQLSQAFGANIDAFKLMEAQNPAEQFDLLRKSMMQVGKTSENMSRQELKLLAQQTGMDEQTAKLAFSMKNQGMGLDQIKKKSGDAEKKTLTQAEAMNKLADAIERLVPQGGGMGFTSFWDAFVKGFLGGIQSSKEFREIMINIQQSLRLVYQEGVRLGRAFVDMFPGVKDFLQGIADFFQPQKFKRLVGGVVNVFIDFMKKLQNGNGSFADLMDNLREKFFDFFDAQSPSGKKLINGFKTVMKTVLGLLGEGIKWIVPKITEGLKTLVEVIKNPKKFMDAASGAGGAGKSMLYEILEPLIKSLNDPAMWKELGNAFMDFLSAMWKNVVKPALWAAIKEMPGEVWAGVAVVMFGPSVGRAVLGAAAEKMAGAVMKKFFDSAAKAATEKVAEEGVKKATESVLKKGIESGAESAGPAVQQGLWSRLMPFITTVPSGAAMAGAAAWGAALAAIAAAAVAAYTIWEAKDMQEKAVKDYTSGQGQIINALSKQAGIEEKKKALALRDAQIKAQEDVLKDKKSSMISGTLDMFREAWEIALNDTHTTTEDMIAKMKRDREDLNAQIEKMNAETAKKAENDANKKRILDAMGPITTENAAEKFKKISDLAKKVMSKDFDLGEKMTMIRDKLASVDFTLFKDKKAEDQVNQTLSSLESIKALFAVISDVGILSSKATGAVKTINTEELNRSFASLKTLGDTIVVGLVDPKFVSKMQIASTYAQSIQVNSTAVTNSLSATFTGLTSVSKMAKDFTNEIKSGGIQKSLQAVDAMVKVANDLNTALSNGAINKIDIKAKLGQVAKAVGLGGSASYTVNPSKEVVITVNMTVTMNAGEVERVILQREGSVLRDRLNFATGNPDSKATSEIPNSPNVPTPKAISGTKT